MSVSCTSDISTQEYDCILAIGDGYKNLSSHHCAGLKQNDHGKKRSMIEYSIFHRQM